MKRYLYTIIISILIIELHAQGRYEVHLGASQPTYAFADQNPDIAIYGGSGCAETGADIGFKYYFPATSVNGLANTKGFYYVFNVNLYYNNVNNQVKNVIKSNFELSENYDYSYVFCKYLNIPFMGGIRYQLPVSSELSLTGDVLLGFNYSQVTNIKATAEYLGSRAEMIIDFDPIMRFSQQIGIGLLFDKKYSIGLSYSALGRYGYKSTQYLEAFNAQGESIGADSEELNASKLLNISSLNFTVGVFFNTSAKKPCSYNYL